MSGHSHWKNVKKTKDAESKKRSLTFARIGRVISLAAKEGSDIEQNPILKTMVEKAKKMNVPKENIEKAIKKGIGDFKSDLQEFIFEAYGPGGIALIIEGITDNINRTSSEIKKTINQYNGKIAESGSVRWLFNRKGLIEINCENIEDIELIIIDSGAWDFKKKEDKIIVYTDPKDLEKIKNFIELKNFKVDSSFLTWVAKDKIKITNSDKEKALNFMKNLNENEDIQKIYSNLE